MYRLQETERSNGIGVMADKKYPRYIRQVEWVEDSYYIRFGSRDIRMHEDSIAKTAFSTPDGHYEFTRLPFGLKNAPAEFSRIMFIILGDLPFIEIYIDDIIIHSEDMERHVKHVTEVLNRIE